MMRTVGRWRHITPQSVGYPPKTSLDCPCPRSTSCRLSLWSAFATRCCTPCLLRWKLYCWSGSKPFAVGCMSVTTAFAVGYNPKFCQAECARTTLNPLFDSAGWLPADTLGWYPAMLLPSDDTELARQVIRRGIESDASMPPGTLYLVRTSDAHRNVRAATYPRVALLLSNRLVTVQEATPETGSVTNAIGYFTGASRVAELPRVQFRPGSASGSFYIFRRCLAGRQSDVRTRVAAAGRHRQLRNGLGALLLRGKNFPISASCSNITAGGDTALEAYWKSVAMPGQGLFIGEPLARPYAELTDPLIAMKLPFRIVFVNRYYDPDQSATSQLLTDLAKNLAAEGFAVHVVCSRQLYDEPGRRLPKEQILAGVTIHRVVTTRFGRGRLTGRALDYASFYISCALQLLRLLQGDDVLIAKTDPPLLSLLAAPIAKIRGVARSSIGCKISFRKWPSRLRANPLPRVLDESLQRLRDASLHAAATNVVIGGRMREYLLDRGLSNSKLDVIENWADAPADPAQTDHCERTAGTPGSHRPLCRLLFR